MAASEEKSCVRAAPEPMIVGIACPNPSGIDSWSALSNGPELPICPDCSGKLKHALAIARFIERPDVRILMCQQCHHVHWFAIEDGGFRKF